MTTVLRRIEPVSFAKIYAVITGALMLLLALPAGCFMLLTGGAAGEALGAGFGLILLVLYPVVGVVGGFVVGWLYGFIYNLVADRVGGVEIELDEPLGAAIL